MRGDGKKSTLPDGYTEETTYDANGNAKAYQDSLLKSNGYPIQYTYNALDAVTNINYPGTTPDVAFGYDTLQRVNQMVDGTGTTWWNYDEFERLQSMGLPGGGFTNYYNSSWQRTSMNSSEGTTLYTYSAGELYSLTNPHGETTTWSRDGAGRLSKQTLSTGSYTDYGYDSQGRNTSITHKKSNGTVISQESYAFDPVGNMSSKTVDGVVTNYGYDNADQLISESRSGYAASYTYDGNGNRLSKTLNGVVEAYIYDDGDKMLSAGAKTYAYDLAGRTMSVTSPSGTTNLWYDEENRLTQVNTPGGGSQTYTYNGLDARRTKTSGATTNTFKRLGASPTSPVVKDSNATYTPGVSERRGGVSKWAHSDYLGSAKQLTNSSQSVTDTKEFDAFGMQTGTTGSTPTPFGFAGGWGYQSDETGLQLLGHRYYDPSTGRFLTRDPIKDGKNWYVYCENNPISYVDPEGLQVGQPGPIEEWVPVWGSGRSSVDHFQNGQWGWGLFYGVLAVSDVFIVGLAVKGAAKLGVKGLAKLSGSHTHKATSKWATKTGLREFPGQPLHHWGIAQNSKLGKKVPALFKNQPWNYKAIRCHEKLKLTPQQVHAAIHGKGNVKLSRAQRLWLGSPTWAKATAGYGAGRLIGAGLYRN